MKQTKFLLGACLALTLAGCSDEVGITADQLPVSGDEITFGAAAGQFTEPTKRTVYGIPEGQDYSNFSALTINWLPGQDQVRVYCPNPSEQQWADYTVMAGTTGTGGTASGFYLQRTDENAQGVRWGDDLNEEHKFYSFYPLKTSNGAEISGLQGDTKVRATIPTAQLSGEVTSNTDQGTQRTWYVVDPDMSYAMMVGTGTWSPGADKNITLNYKPIVTVLDVYVNGPDKTDPTAVSYTITGVGVRSASQPIVGTFEYDVEAGTCIYQTPGSGDQDDNWAYVEVEGVDNSGNGLVINPGEGMNVKFFLMPQDIDPSELTVYVFLSNGSVLSQPLGTGNGSALAKGEIVKVLTPRVKAAPVSNWMSAIGNDVLFASQLSLPGTKHSYSYIAYESNTIFGEGEDQSYNVNSGIMQTYQTLNISQQFDAGVRAFNVKLNANPDIDNYPGQPCVYLGNENVTSETIEGLLNELKKKLDASPTEFVVLTIDFVNDHLSRQDWLTAVVEAIDNWSRAQGPVDNVNIDDGTDDNNNDQDYFREVTATTTVGNMRHGIGVVILVPEYVDNGDGDVDNQTVSWTSQNVNVITNFNSSVQNTSIWNASMSSQMGSADISIQNLQQVNNPNLDAYPYFITEQYVLDNSTSMDLIEAKKTLMRQLMFRSFGNNTGESADKTSQLYINDLSGFCVVNNDESTGWADAEWSQAWTGYAGLRDPVWNYGGNDLTYGFRSEHMTDYRTWNSYTYFEDPQNPSLGTIPNDPSAEGETALRITGRGNTSRGQGGNAALLAQEINPEAERLIRAFVNDGRTPLGIVFMNFAGKQTVNFNNVDYTVYGETLPALIVANNFKFALATSKTAQQGN